jgi:hypothetical protein
VHLHGEDVLAGQSETGWLFGNGSLVEQSCLVLESIQRVAAINGSTQQSMVLEMLMLETCFMPLMCLGSTWLSLHKSPLPWDSDRFPS